MDEAASPVRFDPPIQLWIEQLKKNAVVWFTASFVLALIGSASTVGGEFFATVWAHDVLGWQVSDQGYALKFFFLALLPVSIGGAIYFWIALNYHGMTQRCLLSKEFAAEQVFGRPTKPLDLFVLGVLYYVTMGLAGAVASHQGLSAYVTTLLWFLIGPIFAFTLPLMALNGMRWQAAIVGSISLVRREPALVYATVWGCSLLSLIGVFACGVGLLFTIPVYFIGVNRFLLIRAETLK